ncbi:MAG TPA: TonB-dependent receptor [Azospirillaceae bacterium]|nr:TonB-dependent receptor [Azospirillaceae bacterium]
MRKLLLGGAAAVACLPSQALAQQAADHGRGGIGEVVVTAAPFAQRRLDILQGTSVLSGEALDRALGPSLGETLDRLPGMSQTAFGQGASRPVIRGLGGDRIRVLTAGIGSIDASTTSPDHAPAIDPATARRIEVVRGPGTLLYGSNAIGGVVNVLDGRVPSELPAGGAAGRARLSFGTNANEKLASAGLDVGVAGPLVLHADGFIRHANDYEAPGFLRSRPLREAEPPHEGEEEEKGRVENSAAEGMGATGGLSYVGDWGFIGASVSRLDTKYGIPGGHGHGGHEEHEGEEEHEEEEHEGEEHGHEDVRIDLGQTRVDLIGEVNSPFLAFETTRLRFGWADYEHKELEGDEVGTRFLNDGWEGRVEFVQRQAALMGGTLGGAVGAQALRRDFRAIGDEAFVPPSVTDQWGVFAVERLDFGPFALEGGARLERQEVTARSQGFDRGFTGISLSAGLSHEWAQGWLAGLSVSRTERAPNAEELLSDGPHLATGTYEIGDPTLGEETALGFEATVKRTIGPVTGSVNLFYTDYDDFIAELFTGEEEDELPVARYGAVEARFWGAELEASAEAWRSGDRAVLLDAGLDFVRARNRSDDTDLPRIPPLTVRLGAEYLAASWSGRVEVELADDQKRTAEFELPTAGYAVLNAGVDWHPWAGHDFSLALEGRNLTDETVRLSSSFLKDRLPQPGRDVRLILRTAF